VQAHAIVLEEKKCDRFKNDQRKYMSKCETVLSNFKENIFSSDKLK
jgi:hypothetical protein